MWQMMVEKSVDSRAAMSSCDDPSALSCSTSRSRGVSSCPLATGAGFASAPDRGSIRPLSWAFSIIEASLIVPSFFLMSAMWNMMVEKLVDNRAAMSSHDNPSAKSCSTSRSRGVSSTGAGRASPADLGSIRPLSWAFAIISASLIAPSFLLMSKTWPKMVETSVDNRAAISSYNDPSAKSCNTSRSRRVSSCPLATGASPVVGWAAVVVGSVGAPSSLVRSWSVVGIAGAVDGSGGAALATRPSLASPMTSRSVGPCRDLSRSSARTTSSTNDPGLCPGRRCSTACQTPIRVIRSRPRSGSGWLTPSPTVARTSGLCDGPVTSCSDFSNVSR